VPADQPAPTWDEVLSSFEQGAEHAAALVAGDPSVPPAVAAYDVWALPLSDLPADLHARARAVHERQLRLIDQLQASMLALQQQQLTVTPAAEPRAAIYVDHRV
jgi:hypothetical protein